MKTYISRSTFIMLMALLSVSQSVFWKPQTSHLVLLKAFSVSTGTGFPETFNLEV